MNIGLLFQIAGLHNIVQRPPLVHFDVDFEIIDQVLRIVLTFLDHLLVDGRQRLQIPASFQWHFISVLVSDAKSHVIVVDRFGAIVIRSIHRRIEAKHPTAVRCYVIFECPLVCDAK